MIWGIKGTKNGSELEAWPQADNGVTFVHPVTYNAAAGKWGNGVARKNAITNAGYDYKKVQARVNELLKK